MLRPNRPSQATSDRATALHSVPVSCPGRSVWSVWSGLVGMVGSVGCRHIDTAVAPPHSINPPINPPHRPHAPCLTPLTNTPPQRSPTLAPHCRSSHALSRGWGAGAPFAARVPTRYDGAVFVTCRRAGQQPRPQSRSCGGRSRWAGTTFPTTLSNYTNKKKSIHHLVTTHPALTHRLPTIRWSAVSDY